MRSRSVTYIREAASSKRQSIPTQPLRGGLRGASIRKLFYPPRRIGLPLTVKATTMINTAKRAMFKQFQSPRDMGGLSSPATGAGTGAAESDINSSIRAVLSASVPRRKDKATSNQEVVEIPHANHARENNKCFSRKPGQSPLKSGTADNSSATRMAPGRRGKRLSGRGEKFRALKITL